MIDISDLKTPAYCFVRKPGAETHTAWQYLRGVYPSRFAGYPLDWPFERTLYKGMQLLQTVYIYSVTH